MAAGALAPVVMRSWRRPASAPNAAVRPSDLDRAPEAQFAGRRPRRRARPLVLAVSHHERFDNDRRASTTVELARGVSLAFGDTVAVLAAGALVSVLLPGQLRGSMNLLILAVGWLLVGSVVYKLHTRQHAHLATTTLDDLPALLQWSLVGTAIMVMLGERLSPGGAILLAASLFAFACSSRLLATAAWRRFGPRERLLLIGGGWVSERFARKLALEPTLNADVVAHVGDRESLQSLTAEELAATLVRIVPECSCDRIVVGADDLDARQMRAVTEVGHLARLRISVLPTSSGAIGSRARLRQVAELPLLEFHCRPIGRVENGIKHGADLVLSAIGLVLTLPLFIAVAIAIRLEGAGPVFYVAHRAGQGGKPFRMFKFRTMTTNAGERLHELIDVEALVDPMFKLSRDPRMTRVGAFLRRSSLDELPQLLNVLRREMSIVGPRPEDVCLVARYDEEALAIRCGMRPGITGPMQIHGRGNLTFRERLDVEREYLENYSLGKDVRILAVTVSKLIFGQGAY